MVNLFESQHRQNFEEAVAQVAGRAIKISVVTDKTLPPPVLNKLPEPDRSHLADAMKLFNASDAVKVSD